MDKNSRYIALRLALSDQMHELSGDRILTWLDYLPSDVVFRCLRDVVREFLLCGIDPDDTGWEIVRGLIVDLEPLLDVDVRDGEVVIIDVMGQVVWKADIPEWLIRLNCVIELITDVYGRPITARQLFDTLICLWHPHLS